MKSWCTLRDKGWHNLFLSALSSMRTLANWWTSRGEVIWWKQEVKSWIPSASVRQKNRQFSPSLEMRYTLLSLSSNLKYAFSVSVFTQVSLTPWMRNSAHSRRLFVDHHKRGGSQRLEEKVRGQQTRSHWDEVRTHVAVCFLLGNHGEVTITDWLRPWWTEVVMKCYRGDFLFSTMLLASHFCSPKVTNLPLLYLFFLNNVGFGV